MVLETGIPAVFMAIGDMLFTELVATDVVLTFCSRLEIFNGFMETDEDLHVLVKVMGLERLTGRGGIGADSIQKEIHRPLRKSHSIAIRTNSIGSSTAKPSLLTAQRKSTDDKNDIEAPNPRVFTV